MIDKVLVSNENLEPVLSNMISNLKNAIKNKDISLPYTTQLSKSVYLKIDGNGNMFLNNGGKYIDLGNIDKDKLDINKIYQIFSIVNQQEQWDDGKTIKNMPVVNANFGCVEYSGKIYCIGGLNNTIANNILNTMYIYDISSSTWSTGPNIPVAMFNLGCIIYKGKIYCIGGDRDRRNASGILSSVYIYDILSNTWSNGTNMPETKSGFGCTEYNGKIYCFGGIAYQNLNHTYVKTTYIYDILTNTWKKSTDMPAINSSFGCVNYNGNVYCIAGGINGGNYTAVNIYSTLSETWSTGTNMPIYNYGFGCVIFKGKIYCLAGYNYPASDYVRYSYIYDVANNKWSTGVASNFFRSYFGYVQYNGKIYCLGGNVGSYVNDTRLYYIPQILFNIPMPDSLYSKLNEIITSGDGTKVFHNDGKYTAITPTYQVMDSTQVSDMMNRLISE